MALHIVLFPWLAFGHLIPFFQLAKCLAQRRIRVSFVSTPRNIHRLPKIPLDLAHLLKFVEFPLPQVEHLPDNAEATSDLPLDKIQYLKKAFDGLESPLANLLETISPDWLIYDFVPHWLPPIAAKLDVPCAFFSIYNAAVMCFIGPPSCLLSVAEDSRTNLEEFTVPPKWVPFPSTVAFRMHEILRFFNSANVENVSEVSDIFRVGSAIQGCDIVAVRSCRDFEAEWLDLLQDELYRKPVLPVGLLPPQLEDTGEDEKWAEIKNWLDKQERHSVVYVAFGSEAAPSQQETTELAIGLELSELPFFWVLRNPTGLPAGFEDRVKGRGIVWRDWVPQMRILSHPSMGGSLNHSGWSSVIETLGLGYPLVLLPMVNDQALLARLLASKKVGLEIPRNELDGTFTRESVAESLRKVMVDKEGELYRSTAKDLRKVFGDKVVNDNYVDDFVSYLQQHCRGKSGPRDL